MIKNMIVLSREIVIISNVFFINVNLKSVKMKLYSINEINSIIGKVDRFVKIVKNKVVMGYFIIKVSIGVIIILMLVFFYFWKICKFKFFRLLIFCVMFF